MRVEIRSLSPQAFRPFGHVIAPTRAVAEGMNAGDFERFADLAPIDIAGGDDSHAVIGIVESAVARPLPWKCRLFERHPLGSQAFVPLAPFDFVVVVAPPGESIDPGSIRAFRSTGQQGISYRRGVWHGPLRAFAERQRFLVVDRAGPGNCDFVELDRPVRIEAADD